MIGASGVPILDGPVDSHSYVTRCHVVFGSANGVIMVISRFCLMALGNVVISFSMFGWEPP